jgi:hypothetical protein
MNNTVPDLHSLVMNLTLTKYKGYFQDVIITSGQRLKVCLTPESRFHFALQIDVGSVLWPQT